MFGINNGGPAFPLAEPGNCVSASEGMSLRDYFAAKAMQGDWAAQGADCGMFVPDAGDDPFNRSACMYYRMADAMLAARGQQP